MAKNHSLQKRLGVAVPLGALYSKNNKIIGEFEDLIPFAQFCKKSNISLSELKETILSNKKELTFTIKSIGLNVVIADASMTYGDSLPTFSVEEYVGFATGDEASQSLIHELHQLKTNAERLFICIPIGS